MSPLLSVYAGLEPAEAWRHFAALNQIPRPSGREAAARHYVQEIAESQSALWKSDARGNCVVRVPPRGGSPEAPIVVLQSHLDMVCQKRPDVEHDFERDPISPRRVGDQIYASGTTLGADNGMGAALALAILTSPDLTHGPLELLFTVEEETGLYGAAHLDPELVRGRLLINLDSEDPDELTIGCAGGATTSLFLPVKRENSPDGFVGRKISVGGLKGGHSGVQIHEPLGNALKILGEVLDAANALCPNLRLCALEGGTVHNAIPRDAAAFVAVPAAQTGAFETGLNAEIARLEAIWRPNESGLLISQLAAGHCSAPLDVASHQAVMGLLRDLPHGISQMSERFAGKVQTSTNLAEIRSGENEIEFHTSSRSFVAAELKNAQNRIAERGKSAGARVEVRDGYPGWEPNADSSLLRATERAFEKVHGQAPRVEVVHAGLECGILSEKLPGLDAISFGPLIRGAHTPEEWVAISSVETTWRVLAGLLEELAGSKES